MVKHCPCARTAACANTCATGSGNRRLLKGYMWSLGRKFRRSTLRRRAQLFSRPTANPVRNPHSQQSATSEDIGRVMQLCANALCILQTLQVEQPGSCAKTSVTVCRPSNFLLSILGAPKTGQYPTCPQREIFWGLQDVFAQTRLAKESNGSLKTMGFASFIQFYSYIKVFALTIGITTTRRKG